MCGHNCLRRARSAKWQWVKSGLYWVDVKSLYVVGIIALDELGRAKWQWLKSGVSSSGRSAYIHYAHTKWQWAKSGVSSGGRSSEGVIVVSGLLALTLLLVVCLHTL